MPGLMDLPFNNTVKLPNKELRTWSAWDDQSMLDAYALHDLREERH